MKTLLFGIFMIFGVTLNANFTDVKNAKISDKNYVSNFVSVFTEKLKNYIEYGDTNELASIMNENNLCLLFWANNKLSYSPSCSGTKDEFKANIPQYLDIRSKNPTFVRWTEGEYKFIKQEWGGAMVKLTITYDNTNRIDHILVTTDEFGKIKAFSVHKDVVNNPYYDYNINKLIEN